MIWSGIGLRCHTPLVRIVGILNSQRYMSEVLKPVVHPYIQRSPSAIFQQDNARPHVARNVQDRKRLARDTQPTTTLDPLRYYVEAAWSTVPQGYIQSLFDSIPRRVAAVIANNDGYTNY
ncbi:UNVERIFIED_CONTAM: Transposable element Tcb1 transposase [Trichonephila clavipes]